jgi:hypothetical protein
MIGNVSVSALSGAIIEGEHGGRHRGDLRAVAALARRFQP